MVYCWPLRRACCLIFGIERGGLLSDVVLTSELVLFAVLIFGVTSLVYIFIDVYKRQEYEVSSGGGMVKVVISGTRQIKSISIAPAAVDPDDVEMLQDLVTAAVNEAISTVDKDYNDTMGALTGGLNIPGLGL